MAVTAAELQPCGVLETNLVVDLRFEREDLLLRVVRGPVVDLILARVEPETFGEPHGVGPLYRRAQSFDRGEDLLVEIPLDV